MRVRGHPIEPWKITTPLLLALAFAVGSMGGALLNLKWHLPVTLLCGYAYLGGGLGWSLLKRFQLRRAASKVAPTNPPSKVEPPHP
jgi:hypothetical protein